MSNEERIVKVFSESLGIDAKMVKGELKYNTIPEWDSIGHMALITALELEFDVMLDTDDIIDMSSVTKAKEILGKYDVDFL